MNRQLLHRIADHIDAMPESFDLSLWADKAPKANICDTVGCVAGWAVMISEPITRQAVALGAISLDHFPWDARATKALDLPAREADTLFASNAWWGTHMRAFGFEPADGWDDWDDDYVALGAVTPKAAAHILRALADGEINLGGDWPND